ncbi:MAG TPA: hypothetical protein PKA64_01310 [Myxococcota bacterium]|nr:hypothetical protein [Myxococcota bacterium]
MRPAVAFAVPFVVVAVAGAGAWTALSMWPRATGEPRDATFASLDLSQSRYVRLRGTTHYEAVLQERVPGGLIRGSLVYYGFGLFPEGDFSGRAIPVLVWTQRAPPRRIDYEYLTIEGILSAPDARSVPPEAEDILAAGGAHWFSDSLVVLRPVRILSEDGEWIEP